MSCRLVPEVRGAVIMKGLSRAFRFCKHFTHTKHGHMYDVSYKNVCVCDRLKAIVYLDDVIFSEEPGQFEQSQWLGKTLHVRSALQCSVCACDHSTSHMTRLHTEEGEGISISSYPFSGVDSLCGQRRDIPSFPY